MKRVMKFGMPALAAIAALAVVAMVSLMSSPTNIVRAQTGETPRRTDVGASGTGRVFVDPDLAVANMGVEITAPTLSEATAQANETMTAVINAIKALGVDEKDIQTSSYNVFPITNQPEEGQTAQITGYRVSNVVTVKVRKVADLGKVLDAALGAGANSVNSVYFTVNDPTKYQDEARVLAVQQAQATAKVLADAAGVKLGRLIAVTDLTNNVIPLFSNARYESAQAGGAGPMETGQTEITASVELHYEMAE